MEVCACDRSKKAAEPRWFLSYDDIVEEALCFGWVDSLPRTLDAQRSMRLAVDRAKRNGSWTKLDSVEELVVPPDLQRALRAHPGASKYFEAFPRSSKRIILEWIAGAKSGNTRARRVEETAALAAQNRRAHHWREPSAPKR